MSRLSCCLRGHCGWVIFCNVTATACALRKVWYRRNNARSILTPAPTVPGWQWSQVEAQTDIGEAHWCLSAHAQRTTKSRSPSAVTVPPSTGTPRAVATALSVTPAQATSACISISPEHAARPSPPDGGCRPACTRALPVATLQAIPTSRFPWADRESWPPGAVRGSVASAGLAMHAVLQLACRILVASRKVDS